MWNIACKAHRVILGFYRENFEKCPFPLWLVPFQPVSSRILRNCFAAVLFGYFPILPSWARISLMGGISPMFVRTESAIPATMMVSTS